MNDNIIKKKLSIAYNTLASYGWDDHTYTHLTARSIQQDSFFIGPFGLTFKEIQANNLVCINVNTGQLVEGKETILNTTAYPIHASIYQQYPNIQAIFHLHTPEIVAVSACKNGLMPWSQWSLHCLHTLSYYDYDSLILNIEQAKIMANSLKNNKILLLRHHGSITTGKTIQEAMFFTYHLQMACKTQCLIHGSNDDILPIKKNIIQRARNDIISFEKDLGQRDFQAWERLKKNIE